MESWTQRTFFLDNATLHISFYGIARWRKYVITHYNISPLESNVFTRLLIRLAGFAAQRAQCCRIPYTVKNGYRFSRPQPGCHFPNSPWPGIIKLFPARESFVSDVPAGDGKITNIFLQCIDRPVFAERFLTECKILWQSFLWPGDFELIPFFQVICFCLRGRNITLCRKYFATKKSAEWVTAKSVR